MTSNPLLEEIWATKARLDAEAGGDIHVFCQQLREWSSKNLPAGMVVHDPLEIPALLVKKEAEEPLLLREEPQTYGARKG